MDGRGKERDRETERQRDRKTERLQLEVDVAYSNSLEAEIIRGQVLTAGCSAVGGVE